MRARTCAIALVFLVSFISIPAFAQRTLKIAVVDTDKAFQESIWGKKAMEALEKELEEWQDKGEQLDREIVILEEQLATQKGFFDDEEKEQELRDTISSKRLQGQQLVERGNAALTEKRQTLLDPISEEIRSLIKKLAINENYDLILEKQLFVLYLNPELDITSRVVVMLDTAYLERSPEKAKESEKLAPKQTEEKSTE